MRNQLVSVTVAALMLSGAAVRAEDTTVPAVTAPASASSASLGAQAVSQGAVGAASAQSATTPSGAGTEAQGVATPVAPATEGSSSAPVVLSLAVSPPADFKPPPGYRTVTKGLTTLYCKSETPIGSRMPQTHCYTAEQVEEIERQSQAARQMMHEKARTGGTSGN